MNFESLTKLEQQEVVEILEQFDLNEKDRKVYFALLKIGKTTITPVSKVVQFPVTTVQSVLVRLEKKGLLQVTTQKTRHIYEAHDPIVFKKLIERKLQDINGILPILNKLKSEDSAKTKFRLYRQERMSDIFHEALEAKSKIVYEIVSARDIQEILGEKFHFTKRRVKNGVKLKSLRVEVNEIKKYNQKVNERELREAKFLPRELTFRSSIMFWDNTVAFFTTKEEALAWTIESSSFIETITQIFDLLWSVSRKMDTIEKP